MATLHRADGRQIIQWMDRGKRRTLSMGRVSDRTARRVQSQIETMLSEIAITAHVSPESAAWVEASGPKLKARLQELGFAPPAKAAPLLGDLLEAFMDWQSGKDATIESYEKVKRNLLTHFGRDCIVDSIDELMAEKLRVAMLENLAPPTVNRRIVAMRSIWKYAVKHGYAKANPFSAVKAGTMENASRKVYVPADIVRRVIDQTADVELRLIIALARFGGLRTPSEHLELRWADMDWSAGTFTVRSSKIEHHAGGGVRTVPMFGDLMPYLRDAFDHAEPGEELVITERRRKVAAMVWRKNLLSLIRKAGLSPWCKIWHNLRASCITDLLAAGTPITAVASWMGNSAIVSHRHYAMITPDMVRAAKALHAGALSTTQHDSNKLDEALNTEVTKTSESTDWAMRGSNPSQKPPDSSSRCTGRCTTELPDTQLASIIDAWPRLAASTRSAILRLIGGVA